jgi:hypothetical protein
LVSEKRRAPFLSWKTEERGQDPGVFVKHRASCRPRAPGELDTGRSITGNGLISRRNTVFRRRFRPVSGDRRSEEGAAADHQQRSSLPDHGETLRRAVVTKIDHHVNGVSADDR